MLNSLRQRKPCRQPGIDYARPGFYFVTICTKEKEEILGKVVGENMDLNDYGRIVQECWLDLPNHYRCCQLHEFVIMPNHVHGIIEIVGGSNVGQDSYVGAGLKPARTSKPEEFKPARTLRNEELQSVRNNVGEGLQPSRFFSPRVSLSEIIRGFKTFSSRAINQRYPAGLFQWQRSFHDRVIRDKGELTAIGRYIAENPLHWAEDEENFFM